MLLLAYATNTGNTQLVAEMMVSMWQRDGQTVHMRLVDEIESDELAKASCIVIGCGTWDNWVKGRHVGGQLPDQMERWLSAVPVADWQGKRVAVFGLGESQYPYFCASAILLEQAVTKHGAQLAGESLYINGAPEVNREQIERWARELLV